MTPLSLSGVNTRWWFHSRPAGKLNSLSYWLLALIPALFIYLLLTFVLPRTANYFSKLQGDSEYSDWISSRLPNALPPASGNSDSPFVEALTKLVASMRYGNEVSDAPLYRADAIGQKGKPCVKGAHEVSSMFGAGEIQVYATCATFTPDTAKKLSDSEVIVFKNFAAYMTEAFARAEKDHNEPLNTERTLARAMGLTNTGNASFEVPWIYVASHQSGAIAVFPGTTVIKGPTWETKSRPWYLAAFSNESQLASKGLRDSDLLTVTYLDVLAKKPILVRTYLYRFDTPQPKPGEFVVGIDLKRPDGGSLRRVTLWGADLGALPLTTRLIAALGFSVIFLAMVRWTSANHNRIFVFERLPESKYGMVGLKRTTQLHGHKLTSLESKVEVAVGQYATASAAAKSEQSEGVDVETSVEESLGLSRGVEWWRVSHDRRASWRLFWLRFESVTRADVGQIQVIYSKAILPQTDWTSFNDRVFSEPEANRHRERLPVILKQNADSWDGGYFEISDISAHAPSWPYVDRIPEWVRSVVRAEEVFAVRQGRAYVTLSSTRLDDLYSKADVKAVILASYFERLLKHGQVDFLLRGRTIYRLVSFPHVDARLKLTETSDATYDSLLNSYSPIRSRTLARVDGPIDVEGIAPQPVYDFAILDDKMLVVTHTVMEASVIDVASGREEKPTYRVEGYISWRKSDLEFYCELFEDLAKRSTPLSAQSVA
jgi:hypothetical protein